MVSRSATETLKGLRSWRGKLVLPPWPNAERAVGEAIRTLVEDFGAKEIWVFGSCARRNPDRHSDLDLLVVHPNKSEWIRPASQARLCLSRLPYFLPVDVIVLDPEEWSERKRNPTGIYSDVVRNGVCVYAR